MAKKATKQNPAVNLKVYVKLDPEAQVMFNHQRRDQAVSFPAVVATVATMIKGGSDITGAQEDDKYVVTLDAGQLAEVFAEAREYQATLPATVEIAKQAISTADQAIEFARKNNSGLDLSQAEAKLSTAQAMLKRLVFGKKSDDFREVVETAHDAANTAKQAVVDLLKVKAAGLAKETDTLDELSLVLSDLPSDLDQARKALVEFVKTARTLRVPARPANTNKPNDGHLRERVGTGVFGRTGGYTGRK